MTFVISFELCCKNGKANRYSIRPLNYIDLIQWYIKSCRINFNVRSWSVFISNACLARHEIKAAYEDDR
jgi:hypothetical protein